MTLTAKGNDVLSLGIRLAAILVVSCHTIPWNAAAQAQQLSQKSGVYSEFNWPAELKSVLPDARLNDRVSAALDAFERANNAAHQAEEIYKTYWNVAGYSERKEIIGEDIIFDGALVDGAMDSSTQIMAGSIMYPDGSIATGLFHFISYPNSSIWALAVVKGGDRARFTTIIGELRRPGDKTVLPGDSIVTFKGGDRFSGTHYTHGGAYGVYEKYDGSRRFTGILESINGRLQPENGIVEDQSGKLVAVVFKRP